MKIGIIVDSSAGLSKLEVEKKGWNFLPLILKIDDKEYFDGENMFIEDYYNIINLNSETKTAATPLGIIEEALEKTSKENDLVIVVPLSSGLSTQYNSLYISSQKYKNVVVVENKMIGSPNIQLAENFIEVANEMNTKDITKLKNKFDSMANDAMALVIVEDLSWLVKGGRISKPIAAMAKLTNIAPIISLNKDKDGKLEKFGKGKRYEKTAIKITKEMIEIANERYGKNTSFHILFANPNIHHHSLIKRIEEELKNAKITKISRNFMPPTITNHIGLGSLAIAVVKEK